MGELLRRIRYLFHRRQFDAELKGDMEFHREMAARAGRKNFGNALRIEEQAREAWGWTWLDDLMQDSRFALRIFAKSPGFAAIVVLTMALGIGATTAIFSIVDATLIHPLPYPHAEQLVRLEDDLPGVGASDVGLSIPEFRDLKSSGIFQQVSIKGGGSVNLTGSSQPVRIQFEPVTPQYFALLGVSPELGRTFDPNDGTPGFTLDVVISDALWKQQFGGDRNILGRSLRLDNDVYRVIGVMPPGFHDPGRTRDERSTDLWAGTGFAADPAPPPSRGLRLTLNAVARLEPGLSVQAAQSRLDALVASLEKQYPADYPIATKWTIHLTPLSESVVGNIRPALVLLLCAVASVLLIGCTNVANLLLARASTRSREIAIRQALGAARSRLTRQLLTESLLLSVLGGAVGLAILACTRSLLLGFIPESFPRLNEIAIDWSVLLFSLGISVAAGVVFGLAPIRLASRLELSKALRQEGRSTTGSAGQARARRVLVVTEFALSLVLMIAAGLLLRSFWQLFSVELGFRTEHVMSVQTWLPVPNDPKTDIYGTPTGQATLLREVLRRSRALPGVEEAAVGNLAALPLGHGRNDRNPFPIHREGSDAQGAQPPVVDTAVVSPEYFHLLGMTLLRGRLFTEDDIETAPAVAVINQAMAQTLWPSQNPLGKRFRLNRPNWITVVGVVASARTESPEQAAIPLVYLSAYQRIAKDLAIFLRGQLDPGSMEAEVRSQVQSVDAQLPVFHGERLDDVLSDSLAARRFSLEMVGLFALTALLLAGLGIYGTISYIVGEQTREIGVRLALGADRGAILTMVLGQGLRLAIAGAGVGLAGGLILSRLMTGLLFGVSPADPLTFAAVTLLLTLVALAACYIPARRAMCVDALTALRHE
jgi:predicted permease